LRALGRVNVCAASSLIAAYASTSTTIPEQSSQISSVPINSRAQVSGSRLKKDERTILRINASSLLESAVALEYVDCFVDWQCLNGVSVSAHCGCAEHRVVDGFFRGFNDSQKQGRHRLVCQKFYVPRRSVFRITNP